MHFSRRASLVEKVPRSSSEYALPAGHRRRRPLGCCFAAATRPTRWSVRCKMRSAPNGSTNAPPRQRHFNRKIWTSFAGCLGGSGEVDGVVGRRMGTKWARPPPTGFKSKEGKLLARRRRARAVESFSLSRFVRRGRPPKRTNHSLAGRANEKKDPYPPPIAR